MKLHEWKTRIQSGEHLLGTMVTTFASADLPKILKACGFDFFIIDCEHGSFTTREVADMICVARAIELPGMVLYPGAAARARAPLHGAWRGGTAAAEHRNGGAGASARRLCQIRAHGHRGVSLSRAAYGFSEAGRAAYMQSR